MVFPSPSSKTGTIESSSGRRFKPFHLFLLVLLVGGGAAAFWLVPQFRAWRELRQAQQALDDDNFDSARVHLERCLEAAPQRAEAHFLLARTLRRADVPEAAQVRLEEAERLGWSAREVELERRLTRAQAGMVRGGTEGLEGAARPGEEWLVLEALVRGCLESNFLDQAYQWSHGWIERFPEDWRAYFWEGRVLERGLRYDLALEAYRKSLEHRPNHAETHLRLAEMLTKAGRHAEALSHYENYLASHPERVDALLGLARCQCELGRAGDARTTLERVPTSEDRPAALVLRGRAALESDQLEEALTWLEKAVATDPNDPEANQRLAIALRRAERGEEAEKYETRKKEIEKALRRMEELTKEALDRPNDVDLRFEAGSILMGLGRYPQAARWLLSALLLDRKHAPTRKALAECLPRLGDPKLTELCQRVLENDGSRSPPTNPKR
jgi:tetratricopeptide (TPR) repeat protein